MRSSLFESASSQEKAPRTSRRGAGTKGGCWGGDGGGCRKTLGVPVRHRSCCAARHLMVNPLIDIDKPASLLSIYTLDMYEGDSMSIVNIV